MSRLARLAWLPVTVLLLTAVPLRAQNAGHLAEVPRTRTLPGIESPAFPYAEPEEVGLSSEKLDRLGDEITEWVAAGDLVGAELLIVKDGRAVFHEAYGWADREARVPVERNSIWSIKSMSKPFTATAVLMLADEGRLSLDDPVSRYLPGFAGDERATIRHLLSHTSGTSNDDLGDPAGHESFRDWVEDWASREPTGTFGEYEYTDFGFAAAGYVVEEVTGIPIGTFTEERIIGPLGLDDTSTFFSGDPAWRARLNPWYQWNYEAAGYELRWTADFAGGAGWPFYPAAWGMFSTAMDFAEFMALWMNGGEQGGVRLLSEETVEEALREHARGGLDTYGYGWMVDEEPRRDGMPASLYHGGGDGTMALALPDAHAMLILLTHSRGGAHLSALHEIVRMLEVFDHPGPSFTWAEGEEVAEAELSPDERAPYVGTYALEGEDPRWVAHVQQVGGLLHLRVTLPGSRAPAWWWHLVPLGNHRFAPGRYGEGGLEAVHPRWRARFEVDDGRATAFEVIDADETLFSAERTDPDWLRTEVEARRSRVSIADVVLETLEAGGIEAAQTLHRDLRASRPDSVRFDERLLNALGYRLLREGRIDEAVAVLEMNVAAYPEEPNPYDSLGNVFRAVGRLEDARRSQARAVELAERQGDDRLPTYRANLERITQELEGQ